MLPLLPTDSLIQSEFPGDTKEEPTARRCTEDENCGEFRSYPVWLYRPEVGETTCIREGSFVSSNERSSIEEGFVDVLRRGEGEDVS